MILGTPQDRAASLFRVLERQTNLDPTDNCPVIASIDCGNGFCCPSRTICTPDGNGQTECVTNLGLFSGIPLPAVRGNGPLTMTTSAVVEEQPTTSAAPPPPAETTTSTTPTSSSTSSSSSPPPPPVISSTVVETISTTVVSVTTSTESPTSSSSPPPPTSTSPPPPVTTTSTSSIVTEEPPSQSTPSPIIEPFTPSPTPEPLPQTNPAGGVIAGTQSFITSLPFVATSLLDLSSPLPSVTSTSSTTLAISTTAAAATTAPPAGASSSPSTSLLATGVFAPVVSTSLQQATTTATAVAVTNNSSFRPTTPELIAIIVAPLVGIALAFFAILIWRRRHSAKKRKEKKASLTDGRRSSRDDDDDNERGIQIEKDERADILAITRQRAPSPMGEAQLKDDWTVITSPRDSRRESWLSFGERSRQRMGDRTNNSSSPARNINRSNSNSITTPTGPNRRFPRPTTTVDDSDDEKTGMVIIGARVPANSPIRAISRFSISTARTSSNVRDTTTTTTTATTARTTNSNSKNNYLHPNQHIARWVPTPSEARLAHSTRASMSNVSRWTATTSSEAGEVCMTRASSRASDSHSSSQRTATPSEAYSYITGPPPVFNANGDDSDENPLSMNPVIRGGKGGDGGSPPWRMNSMHWPLT